MLHQDGPTFDQGRQCYVLLYAQALIEGSANFKGANIAVDKASTLQNLLFYAHLSLVSISLYLSYEKNS